MDFGTPDFPVPDGLVERISREASTDVCYSNMRVECVIGIDRGGRYFSHSGCPGCKWGKEKGGKSSM